MTPAQMMTVADALRTIKLLAEVSTEAIFLLDDTDGDMPDQIVADIDCISAAAARAALAITEAHPEFKDALQRAEKAAEARAVMVAQKGGAA